MAFAPKHQIARLNENTFRLQQFQFFVTLTNILRGQADGRVRIRVFSKLAFKILQIRNLIKFYVKIRDFSLGDYEICIGEISRDFTKDKSFLLYLENLQWKFLKYGKRYFEKIKFCGTKEISLANYAKYEIPI
jgi:hypothetical protein